MFICELFVQQDSDEPIMHVWQENGLKIIVEPKLSLLIKAELNFILFKKLWDWVGGSGNWRADGSDVCRPMDGANINWGEDDSDTVMQIAFLSMSREINVFL